MTPQIRIKNAWLLRDNVSMHLHELWAKDGDHLASYEEIDGIVESYRKAWEPYEERILQGMQEALGLSFRQNIIDVHIAPWFYAFSDPMVVGVIYTPDRFVEVLTHELIHRLLTDNNETPHNKKWLYVWRQAFGEQGSKAALAHIPVHAVLQALFDDVLGEPERTKNDIEKCQEYKAYKKAWEYVQERGYKEVIEDLKKMYAVESKGSGNQ